VAEKFDPKHASRLENPDRLVELPPANIIALLALGGCETVVDFGAGTGMYSLPVAEALPGGRLVAVDEHAELLGMIRDKLAARPPAGRVDLVLNDHGALPLADGEADHVFMVNVLHHIHDEPGVLVELVRVLAPGGRLVVVDYAQMDRPVGPPNDHVLSLDEARAVLRGIGVRELAVRGPGEVGRYSIALVTEKPAR
jgi:ubiquinone/menaquinone biosynthesis C-methylase UbiE